MNFYICSTGAIGEDYVDGNYEEIRNQKAYRLHKNTQQKGSYFSMKKGDILFLKHNNRLVAYGEVVEQREIENDWGLLTDVKEFYYCNPSNFDEGVSNYGVGYAQVGGIQYDTVKTIDATFALQKMKEIASSTQLYINTYNLFNMQKHINILEENKNIILTGAPGTGKTYLAKQIAEQMIAEQNPKSATEILNNAISAFVHNEEQQYLKDNLRNRFLKQFPASDLSKLTLESYCIGTGGRDNFCWWIERGLRELGYYFPGSSQSYLLYWSKKNNAYARHGYIKDLDDSEAIQTLATDLQKLVLTKELIGENEKKFGKSFMLKILNSYYPDEFFPINSEKHLDTIIKLFDLQKGENIVNKNKIVFDFCKLKTEGTEITADEFCYILYNNFNIKEGETKEENSGEIILRGKWQFVQFHPSYDYTDFVEGLRPIKDDDSDDFKFKLRDGIFKSFCMEALSNPNKKFVFIIDEINRGEISKIFGELFFSIDPGYRGIDGKVVTQYANMQDTPFDEKLDVGEFYIPKNVYIIGTMNDIDRSVESFDFAMRRRFSWVEIKAADRIDMWNGKIDKYIDDAKTKMSALNAAIEKIQGLNSSYHIGPAYFLKLANYQNEDKPFDKLWEYHILPLLTEYLRGNRNAQDEIAKLKEAYGV